MKIVFFGTPDYVIPILDKLHKAFQTKKGESSIAAVVTQQPQPTGRKQILTYSPVDTWAHKKGVPKYFYPMDLIRENVKADLGFIASYGNIIPKDVIEHFPQGIINVHFSLLPVFRGASPVEATIATGKEKAGVSFFQIDDLLDHGPIIYQFTEDVLKEDTAESLRLRLFDRSGEVLAALLRAYLAKKIKLKEQDHAKATFTKIIKRDHAFIPPEYLDAALQGQSFKGEWEISFIKDFTVHPSPTTVHRFIRAMDPWPIAWTHIQLTKNQKRIKILKSHLESQDEIRNTKYEKHKIPYHVSRITYLVLDSVQLEGKNPVSWKQFRQAYPEASF